MNLESFTDQFRNVLKEIPKICLLGIRGYENKDAFKAPNNIYDDAIVSCIDGCVKVFTASVDPGKYYIDHPLNPQGCARLKCGFYHYQIGEHHARKALVQSSEVLIERLDKHGKRVSDESGFFGINIHSGGAEYLVGRYSAGCQVIKTSEAWKNEWLDFFTPILVGSEIYGQKKIPYLLVDRLLPSEEVNSV